MASPLRPPIPPMLAKLARELPRGDFLYEPKWDGFRSMVFRRGHEVEMRSRRQSPFSRYFPELVEGFRALPSSEFVMDGEIVIVTDNGFDFAALLNRLHPSQSRVDRLRAQTPATFVAFDLLALDGRDVMAEPFAVRRSALETFLAAAQAPILLTPATDDASVAQEWLENFAGGGIDGVVAKHRRLSYQPDKRVMIKAKRERTVECVVAGFRWFAEKPLLGSLLLGLYDDAGSLRHVGVSSSFSEARRRELLEEVRPHMASLVGHPWELGFGIEGRPMGRLRGAAGVWVPGLTQDWVPLYPVLVAEVAYDQVDADRFRHPARFVRWRPDRDPRSCTFDQLQVAGQREVDRVLKTGLAV